MRWREGSIRSVQGLSTKWPQHLSGTLATLTNLPFGPTSRGREMPDGGSLFQSGGC